MRTKKIAALAAAAVTATAVGLGGMQMAGAATAAAQPAQASSSAAKSAHVVRTFELNAGTSTLKGKATFTNRSVIVEGTATGTVANPTTIEFVTKAAFGKDGMSKELSPVAKATVTKPTKFRYVLPANVRGGAAFVSVSIIDSQGNGEAQPYLARDINSTFEYAS